MVHFRRFIWFIASKLIWICVVLGILVCTFFMCLNAADIYVIVSDGLEKRVDVILTGEDASELNKYFHADLLIADPALEGALNGQSSYSDYTISDYEYSLEIEKLWSWPWDTYANVTVVERVPSITGKVHSNRKNEVSSAVPGWVGGRYEITLVKVNGCWKINGMRQTKEIYESDTNNGGLNKEVLLQ